MPPTWPSVATWPAPAIPIPRSRRSAGRVTRPGHMGCVFALHGITLALFDRMTTGEGQYIDVSIHDACSMGTESAVPEWLYNGATLYRQTGMHASARRRPDLELPTADGMYVIAVNQTFGDRGWAKLIE